jgi:two-component sensor histidine kinase
MMQSIKKIITTSWLQHLVFWVLSFYAIGNYFAISSELKIIDFIYSAFFHLPLLILVYLNLRVFIPRYLQNENYIIYLFFTVLNIGLAYFIHQVVFDIGIPLMPAEFYMVSFTQPLVLITIFAIYLFITSLLKLSKSWYQLQEVEKEKLSLELNSLKMQINPHFLFNSLNSIYSLARNKSDTTPRTILNLADLMRYMIYEVSDEKVSLSKEKEALEHYIELQKLRLEKGSDIRFDVQDNNPEKVIAPLLFFPLLENSFKHGLKAKEGNYCHISLSNTATNLKFIISNNKSSLEDLDNRKYGGIGLQNVKKRLSLIYGPAANLLINETNDDFKVELTINWND